MKELGSFIDSLLIADKKVSYCPKVFRLTLTVIKHIPLEQQKTIAEAIKAMEYDDFLTTPYWRLLTHHIKILSKHKCRICNSPDFLHIHHRSYDCHGYEYQQFGTELICMCEKCHDIFHKESK